MIIIGLIVSIVLGVGLQVIRTGKEFSKKGVIISIIIIFLCYILGYLYSYYNRSPGIIIYD